MNLLSTQQGELFSLFFNLFIFIVIFFVTLKLLSHFLRDKLSLKTFSFIKKYLASILIIVGIFTTLFFLKVNVTPVAILAGLVTGVQLILAKSVIGTFSSFISIKITNIVNVGDVIHVNGVEGSIEKITIIGTFLKDSNGDTIIINNEDLINLPLTIKSKEKHHKGE